MRREFHAVADLFPLMQGAAFRELVDDIKKNGLHEPILVDAGGRVLDGRNRYRACLEAGVEPRFVEWQGEGSLADLALSLNLKRRHLNESQRAMVAARWAHHISANLRRSGAGSAAQRASGVVNVSPRLVDSALRVLRNGCAELIAAVESGELPVSTGARLASLPQAEQAQIVAGGPDLVAGRVRELRAQPSRETWPFGLVAAEPVRSQTGVSFLWVASSGLDQAVAALEARGFRRNQPEGDRS